MKTLETPRLTLSRLTGDDCKFILELVNEPAFLRYIGDRRVRTEAGAADYLRDGPMASYVNHGYGLLRVSSSETGSPLGICGLVQRDWSEVPDLGFAFLERHWRRGYAQESAQAVLADGFRTLGLDRIIAIADTENERSVRLLGKLGFVFESMVRVPGDDHDIGLYACNAGTATCSTA